MGNWNISINGTGAHHNEKDYDADVLFKQFVELLKEKGQNVESAFLTVGSSTSLTIGSVNR